MGLFLRQYFQIRLGELRITLLMQLFIFLLITALLMLKPVVNALFLDILSANQLPQAYIAVAISAIFVSWIYNRIVQKFDLRYIIVGTLILFAALFSLFAFMSMNTGLSKTLIYIFYVAVALYAVVTTSQFWLLSNVVYNPREAKRLFSFIGAGAIAGGIFGGYITSIFAHVLNSEGIILIGAGCIILCVPIVLVIYKIRSYRLRKMETPDDVVLAEFKFSSLFKSKHVTYLSLVVGFSVIAAKLIDYQFSVVADLTYSDPNDLSSFLGFWFSTFNVIALIVQLTVTHRLLKLFGVTSNLLILPIGLALAIIGILLFPALWIVVLLKGLDGSFKQSINKAALELSIVPMPFQLKQRAKSFIDVVVDSLASGVAGIILIVIISNYEFNAVFLNLFLIFIVLCWIVAVIKLREEYFKSFTRILKDSIHANAEASNINNIRVSNSDILSVFESGYTDGILKTLNSITDGQSRLFHHEILKLVSSRIPTVQVQALTRLDARADKRTIEVVVERLSDRSNAVVNAALDYLLDNPNITDKDFFNNLLDHSNYKIARGALRCLSKQSVDNPRLANRFDLQTRIKALEKNVELHDNREVQKASMQNFLMAVAYSRSTQFYHYINQNLKSENRKVRRQAIKAAGITRDQNFIEPLIATLGSGMDRKSSQKALRRFRKVLIPHVKSLIAKKAIDANLLSLLIKPIAQMRHKQSRLMLAQLLGHDSLKVRLKSSRALTKIQQTTYNINIARTRLDRFIVREAELYKKKLIWTSVIEKEIENFKNSQEANQSILELHTAVGNYMDKHMEFIFNCLSLLYSNADMDIVFLNLKSTRDKAKENALEFLENLMHVRLKRIILPLVNPREALDVEVSANSSLDLQDAISHILLSRNHILISAALDVELSLKSGAFNSLLKERKYNLPVLEQKRKQILNTQSAPSRQK